jgi:hypothetical protein
MKKNLGTLGDLLKDGKPLKEYIEKQTGIEASNEFTKDVRKLNGLVKGKIKERFTPKYNVEPSPCKQWTQDEIYRRNITDMELPEKNTKEERMVEFIQLMDDFTIRTLAQKVSEETEDFWTIGSTTSFISNLFNAVGGLTSESPTLITKKKLRKGLGSQYTITEEFKTFPKQNICKMMADYRKHKKKVRIEKYRNEKKKLEADQETQVQKQEIKGQLLEAEPVETNLVELVKELRPGSVIKQHPDGTLTIVVM